MSKNAIIWTVVAVVVIVIGVAVAVNKHSTPTTMTTNDQSTQMQGASPTPTEAMMSPSPTPSGAMMSPTPTAAPRLSYGDALNTYKNRIQLLACHGTPGTVVVAKGSPVMLDNRDHDSHLVKAGSQSVTVPGSDYALLYPNVKGNFQVTCDGGGAALLEVQ